METEVKLSPAPQHIAEKIMEKDDLFSSEKTVFSMSATYYDTADRDLKKAGLTLRLRQENHLSVCCLKYRINELSRFEAEEQASDIESGINALCARDDLSESIKNTLKKAKVLPVYSSSFERVARLISYGKSTIELCFDYGFLSQDDRILPISEMELELKNGSEEDLISLTESICNEYKLPICRESKAQRASGLTKDAFANMRRVASDNLSVNDIFSGRIFLRRTDNEFEYFTKD